MGWEGPDATAAIHAARNYKNVERAGRFREAMADVDMQVDVMLADEVRGDLQDAMQRASAALAQPGTIVDPSSEVLADAAPKRRKELLRQVLAGAEPTRRVKKDADAAMRRGVIFWLVLLAPVAAHRPEGAGHAGW